jgi:hypothetical protein
MMFIFLTVTCFARYACCLLTSWFYLYFGGRLGRDRMAVGFTTTYLISAYHH